MEPGDFLAMPFPDGGEIYAIPGRTFLVTYSRDGTLLTGDEAGLLSQEEMLKTWGNKLREASVFAKTSGVHAMEADDDGCLETIVGDSIETRKPYKVGDMIMCAPTGERYTMMRHEFAKRYVTSPLMFVKHCQSEVKLLAPQV